ncbi:MAG TPA: M14 family metallopeptidase [Steroidobacteraceae bacterium]|nr:M14 family metallopeptidase [Steroidobacteraceae bacterium]
MDSSFSRDYAEARRKFRAVAAAAGAEMQTFPLDQRGPDDLDLTADTAWIGRRGARAVLVTISGTHGVEGFFGSAVQVEWLRRSKSAALAGDIAALHIHAINPYGFSWLRRTNENNVDINRNWMDFDGPLPANPAYDEISKDLCPADWSAATQKETWRRLQGWIDRHGPAAFQKAASGGQWTHCSGLFYGGRSASWSRSTLTSIVTANLARAARVCLLDFHTGLGPYGYAEPIIGRRRTDPAFARARSWIGGAAKSLYGDGSVSAEIKGDSLTALPGLLPRATVDAVALECGIRPMLEVAQALRADAWLHAHGDPHSDAAKPIKHMIRAAFHSDDPLWQGMALGQGIAACQAAIGGLAAL